MSKEDMFEMKSPFGAVHLVMYVLSRATPHRKSVQGIPFRSKIES